MDRFIRKFKQKVILTDDARPSGLRYFKRRGFENPTNGKVSNFFKTCSTTISVMKCLLMYIYIYSAMKFHSIFWSFKRNTYLKMMLKVNYYLQYRAKILINFLQ